LCPDELTESFFLSRNLPLGLSLCRLEFCKLICGCCDIRVLGRRRVAAAAINRPIPFRWARVKVAQSDQLSPLPVDGLNSGTRAICE